MTWLALSAIEVRDNFRTFKSCYFTLILIVFCNIVNNEIGGFWISFDSFLVLTKISCLVEETFSRTRYTSQWRNIKQIIFSWTLNTFSLRWIIIRSTNWALLNRVIFNLFCIFLEVILDLLCRSCSEIWRKTVCHITEFLTCTHV